MKEYQLQFVYSLLAYAVQKDISPERLCKLSGLDWEVIRRRGKVAITSKQVNDLWMNASHLSNHPLFGLHLGESMQLAALGIVGQIVQNSRTMGEALTHAAEFLHLVTDLFAMGISQGNEQFMVRFIPDTDKAQDYPFGFRHLIDLSLAFVMHELDGLVLARLKPQRVVLPYPTAELAEYERVLRCQLIEKADQYVLAFDDRYQNEPILTANYELQSVLLQQASAMSETLADRQPLKERIYTYLLANAYLGIPTLEGIAANFNTSARSLQRKLQEEGVTYQQLADSIRKSLAVHYLESGKYLIKEVSYILGYSELSAFTRAFKRWTGTTPVSYLHG
ncbi:AraC family transcriptional regulator [Spirosoma sp. RP8]|uniref:AraC family transcriptional regulator n=1 Tax=Spirosoma liriopis TaxID=2937440 RepID=A0ABT0HSU4_9BACT|nr:AraC family transcriptional regulator [Spirosoma liriopis]MCK8495238.1 AraC family transcriptional regulator [Spirosoma liriopis]